MRLSLGSITCKALRAADRITTVVVVVDDTALSFRECELIPISYSNEIADWDKPRIGLVFGYIYIYMYLVLGLGACIETFWVNEPDDADHLIQPDTPSQSSETRELHLDLPSAQL